MNKLYFIPKAIYFTLVAFCLFLFLTSIAKATDNIPILNVTITGKNKEEVLSKGMAEAIQRALSNFGVKPGNPIFSEIINKIKGHETDYILERKIKLLVQRSTDWKGVFSYLVSGRLFEQVTGYGENIIKESKRSIVMAFYLSSSNYMFDGMDLPKEFIDSQQSLLSAKLSETLKELGFDTVKDESVSVIISEILDDYYEPPNDAQEIEFKKRILKAVEENKSAQYVFFGRLDVNSAGIRNHIIHTLSASAKGALVNLKDRSREIPITGEISSSVRGETSLVWDKGLKKIVASSPQDILLAKGLVQLLSAWNSEKEKSSKQIEIKICQFSNNKPAFSKLRKFFKNNGTLKNQKSLNGDYSAKFISNHETGFDLEDLISQNFKDNSIESLQTIPDANFLAICFSECACIP